MFFLYLILILELRGQAMQRFVAGRIFRVANFASNWNTVNKETVKYKQILNLKIHQFQAVTFQKYPESIQKQ